MKGQREIYTYIVCTVYIYKNFLRPLKVKSKYLNK